MYVFWWFLGCAVRHNWGLWAHIKVAKVFKVLKVPKVLNDNLIWMAGFNAGIAFTDCVYG